MNWIRAWDAPDGLVVWFTPALVAINEAYPRISQEESARFAWTRFHEGLPLNENVRITDDKGREKKAAPRRVEGYKFDQSEIDAIQPAPQPAPEKQADGWPIYKIRPGQMSNVRYWARVDGNGYRFGQRAKPEDWVHEPDYIGFENSSAFSRLDPNDAEAHRVIASLRDWLDKHGHPEAAKAARTYRRIA